MEKPVLPDTLKENPTARREGEADVPDLQEERVNAAFVTSSRKRGKRWAWTRRIVTWSAAGLLLFTLYHLFFGWLFSLSPIILGFDRHDCGSAIVYHHGQLESCDFSYLSDVIRSEESYHGMAFRWKPEIFLCKDDGEFQRRTGAKSRFTTINGRVFVSKRAQDDARRGEINLRTYLTHELSHALLQQHVSILRSLRMPHWLLEGTAMDCAGQVGTGIYPPRSTVCQLMAKGIYCEPADYGSCLDRQKGTALTCSVANRVPFFYSEFGCFVAFLRSHHGTQQHQAFLKDVVEADDLDVERSFVRVFGVPLGDEFSRFKAETAR